MKNIIFFLPALKSGGAERVSILLAKEINKKGYANAEILLIENNIHYDITDEIKVHFILDNKTKYSKKQRIYKIYKGLKEFVKNRDEVVLIPMLDTCLRYSVFLKMMINVDVIACERNDPYNQYKKRLQKIIRRFLFKKANFTIFQTKDAKKFYDKCVKNRYKIIANPVKVPQEQWKFFYDGNIYLIMVCRLNKQKNIKMAIDVVERVKKVYPNIYLDIYGEGEEKNELSKYIVQKQLNENVFLKGTTKNIYSTLKKYNIFILTSNFEGISNSMLEALAFGMPTIVTDCPIGGAKMMIDNKKNGILVKVGDSDEFSNKVIQLIRDKEYSIRLGKNARASMRKYSIENIAKKWVDVIINIQKG